jgi:hypothetical protein
VWRTRTNRPINEYYYVNKVWSIYQSYRPSNDDRTIFAFILAAFSGRIFSTPIRNFVIMMIVVYGLLKPTTNVMVIDERTGYNYNVSNVPLGVALFGYFQSSLSRDLVNFFERTLNNGNYYASYAKYGFGFGPFLQKL